MTGRRRTRKGAPDTIGTLQERRNRWHTAADWIETYAPVLWDDLEPRLRQVTARAVLDREQLRATGQANPTPLVIVIDAHRVDVKTDHPDAEKAASRPAFEVLTVAEIRWLKRREKFERQQKLRLARALPNSTAVAWKLVLHELGYVPDVIVTDSDDSQWKAIAELYADEPHPPAVIPSLYHVRRNIEFAVKRTPGAATQETAYGRWVLRDELEDHLVKLGRTNVTAMSVADWTGWWDDIEAILASIGAPLEPIRVARNEHEPRFIAALPTIAQHPNVPLSTGGVEVAIRRRIEPLLDNRGHLFTNLERTNRLLDLVVCDDHGMFDSMPTVIELIRSDSAAYDGWGSPLRAVADHQPPAAGRWTGRYGSLRDPLLLAELARARGLA